MGSYYRVQQGDCLSSIAEQWGFVDYNAIYLDSENADFREKRPNPNILFPGDVLFIPERSTKELARPTDHLHSFVLKRDKVYLRVCLQDDLHQPYKDTKYHLRVGARHYDGRTDDNGLVEQRIVPDATDGEITIYNMEDDPADNGYTFTLNLGHLDPVDEPSGVDARLINLGFGLPSEDEEEGEWSPEERSEVLRTFQNRFGLKVTGEADDATRQKLRQLHDAE
jgi:N-acetylmuramoyl-L-alanine amidase